MDFGFSEEQVAVQTLAREILSAEVSHETLSHYDEYQQMRFDRGLFGKLCESGLIGIPADDQYGGMNLGFTALCLFVEEVGRSIAPVPVINHCVSGIMPIQKYGSIEQRQRYISPAVAGDVVLTSALMERRSEDPSNPIETHATITTEGIRLSGVKRCVPFAMESDRVLLSASSDHGPIVLLLDPASSGVDRVPVQYSTFEPQCDLVLNNVLLPYEDVLGTADNARNILRDLREWTTTALCAHQLGVTDYAMRTTASYTSERKQFEVPVATFQAVGHRAANCYIDVELLRLNTYQAASLLELDQDATTAVQIAKVWAGDAGHRVSYASQHLHGGTGIDRDYPLWRYCLWARHNELMLGSSASVLAELGDCIAAGRAFCD